MNNWLLVHILLLGLAICTNFIQKQTLRFSCTICLLLIAIPVLAGEYFLFACQAFPPPLHDILLSEFTFCFIFFLAINRLYFTFCAGKELISQRLASSVIALLLLGIIIFVKIFPPLANNPSPYLSITNLFHYGAVFSLFAVLGAAWRAEMFWRSLSSNQRWQYKFFIIGVFLISGILGGAFSYRLMYPILKDQHLMLLTVVLLLALALMSYSLARHRLLNRKLFIARQVIYSFTAPSLLAVYLLCLGSLALITKRFGFEIHFVLFWFAVICGIVFSAILILSEQIRQRMKYFVSTNFYNNKYEYRDEWLAFSSLLQGELNENGVANALKQILTDCLYTSDIMIWLGDKSNGYHLISSAVQPQSYAKDIPPKTPLENFKSSDPLIHFLDKNNFLYIKDAAKNSKVQKILTQKHEFFNLYHLDLLAPMIIGTKLVGFIGLGPEYTGSRYGHDDFDLLTALSTQAASAILSVRMAERLARISEKKALDTLSAFILHDIKNAAAMLSLIQVNAAEHIDNPEFQKDMLETINDALKRMKKVQVRMTTLKGEQKPELRDCNLDLYLRQLCRGMTNKFPSMHIEFSCHEKCILNTDISMLESIIENLLLNAFEAEANKIKITLRTSKPYQQVNIRIDDNGTGINHNLLPDKIFAPFVSGKLGGSGIGLWQIKHLVNQLRGEIKAGNVANSGARFTITFGVK